MIASRALCVGARRHRHAGRAARAGLLAVACVVWLGAAAAGAEAAPTITAAPPPPPITLGSGTLDDSVMVSGRTTPAAGATIDFRLYGPHDADCLASPVFESLDVAYPVTDDFVASTPPYVPLEAGTYRWRATYSGDASNPEVTSACADAGQSREVLRASPTMATTASPGIGVGGSLSDAATVTGRVSPTSTATIEFRLYGPADHSCSLTPLDVSTVPYPEAGGTVTSASYTATQPGTYRWRAFYSGDPNNAPAEGLCGDSSETVTVIPPPPPPPPLAPPPPPPPPPSAPLTCPPQGLAVGAVYRGTHSQGDAFCFTLSPDFSLVTSYLATNVIGDICSYTELATYTTGLPIANRAFADPDGTFSGTFSTDRKAQGSLQLYASGSFGICHLPVVSWTATTSATPPWTAPPPPPPLPPPPPPPPPPPSTPTIKLGATLVQRPLRQGAIVVSVSCAARPCRARVSGTLLAKGTKRIAKLAPVTRKIAARSTAKVTLKLSSGARRYIRSALGAKRSLRAKITARVTDSAGRVTTKTASVALRR